VRSRVETSGLGVAIVTNGEGIVLGMLREAQLAGAADGARADAVMRPGPSTFRPNVPITEIATYFTEHDLASAPITSSDGRLIGLLLREAAVGSH
jgi:CBS domain-containing protein